MREGDRSFLLTTPDLLSRHQMREMTRYAPAHIFAA
jgi:hypothetical protein